MKKEELYNIVKNYNFQSGTPKVINDDGTNVSEDIALDRIEKQIFGDIRKAFDVFNNGKVILFHPSGLHGCATKNEITMMDIVRVGGEYRVYLTEKVLKKHGILMPIKF